VETADRWRVVRLTDTIDNAYNMQGASLASETASPDAVATAQITRAGSVPEPSSLLLLTIGAAGLLGRRRRL
jgi:hypothetical protein